MKLSTAYSGSIFRKSFKTSSMRVLGAEPLPIDEVGRVKLGAVKLNEMRDALGLDPYAIYDVKTGRGLEPSRVDELRAKTNAPANAPVIELRFEGAVLKIQFSGLRLC
jgi:hypothetical protein